MEFDAASQKLFCPFCDTRIRVEDYVNPHAAPPEQTPAQAAASQQAMQENAVNGGWAAGETDGMRVYSCGSCGAQIISSEVTGSMSCPFCGNNVVAGEQFSGDLRPNVVLPFQKTREEAIAAYKSYVNNKRLLPKVFFEQNHIDRIRGLYIPYWLYDASVDVDVAFEGTKVSTWADRDYSYTKTTFYQIERAGIDSFERVPHDASKEMPDEMMESLEPFDYSKAVPFNTGYLAGFDASRYDVAAADVKPRILERMQHSVTEDVRGTVSGYATLSMTKSHIEMRKISNQYALYPIWLLETTWQNHHYLFAMNAQSGKFVGELPVSKGRAAIYYLLFGSVFTLIASLVAAAIIYL